MHSKTNNTSPTLITEGDLVDYTPTNLDKNEPQSTMEST